MECEMCGHPAGYDHGMQFTMRGVCSDCVVCYPEEEDSGPGSRPQEDDE